MSAGPAPLANAVALSRAECLQRLACATTGYLATTARALPVVVPVALAAEAASVRLAPVFPSSLAGRHDGPSYEAVVALAVGELGPPGDASEPAEAWSVVAQGLLHTLHGPAGPYAYVLEIEVVNGWRGDLAPVSGWSSSGPAVPEATR